MDNEDLIDGVSSTLVDAAGFKYLFNNLCSVSLVILAPLSKRP
jgi:hypothetical protein